MQYGTTMTGEFFEGWFEGILLPRLPKDAVIVMDNASFHRKKQLYEIAGKNNITLIFLPPYSPELNPIEKVWANMKKFLRNSLHKFSSLDDAIYSFFQVELLYPATLRCLPCGYSAFPYRFKYIHLNLSFLINNVKLSCITIHTAFMNAKRAATNPLQVHNCPCAVLL